MSNSNDLLAALNHKTINEAFEIARTNRTGVLATIGFAMPRMGYDGYKSSWTDAYKDADSVTVDGALSAAATVLVVDSTAALRAGMILANADEAIYVTSVDSATSATIVRGVGGTTGATIADDFVLTIDSVGKAENSLAEDDGLYQPELVENFFQTMDTTINMSRRALATLQYGNTNDLQFQLSERLRQLAINMDRMLIRGRRFTQGTGDNLISYCGGFKFYNDISGAIKIDAGGAELSETLINNVNEAIVNAGGTSNSIAVSTSKARAIQALISANYSSQRLGDWTADEGSVLVLPSDMPLIGSVNQIVVDTNLADSELMIYDSTKIQIVPMAAGNAESDGNWRTLDATAKGQDGQRARIIGDFSIEMRQSKSHMGLLHNIL